MTLLKEWLVKFKFKNWHQTRTRDLEVTPQMKEARAVEIAEKLNDVQRWHSHGRGITIEVLRNEMKLEIEDFGQDAELRTMIKSYYTLFSDYRVRRGHAAAVHTKDLYIPLAE